MTMIPEVTDNAEPDRTRINMAKKEDVNYWTNALNISKVELALAIKSFGNSSAVVRREFRK